MNNWSTTSGGLTNGATPSGTSDVTFDGLGANGNGASTVSANQSINSLTFTSGYTNTVTINTAVVLTISGSFTDNTAHSWTVSGTGAMTISAASTITSGGKTFPGPVTFSGANTKTLSGNWIITGALTISSTTTINKTTSETLTCAGIATNGTTSGTCKIILSGGTWSGNNSTLANDLDYAGNITFGANVNYITGTFTYVSGTSPTGTFKTSGSCTLNLAGITMPTYNISTTQTITLTSLLSVTTMTILQGSNPVTFAGTSGFTVGTFTVSEIQLGTTTLKNSVTYTITTAFNAFNSRTGSILTFTSDDATLKANLTLNQGATCNVLASFTRIDASGGRVIFTFNGTLTTTTNITAITDLSFVTGRAMVIQGNSNY